MKEYVGIFVDDEKKKYERMILNLNMDKRKLDILEYLTEVRGIWRKYYGLNCDNKMDETVFLESVLDGIPDRNPYISEKSYLSHVKDDEPNKYNFQLIDKVFRKIAQKAKNMNERRQNFVLNTVPRQNTRSNQNNSRFILDTKQIVLILRKRLKR